jgi:hypothetical protein
MVFLDIHYHDVILFIIFQLLLEESARLKTVYPGANAVHIAKQQTTLAELWRDLQDATIFRRDRLRAAWDLQRFLGTVCNIILLFLKYFRRAI